jgi:hypothetical protein
MSLETTLAKHYIPIISVHNRPVGMVDNGIFYEDPFSHQHCFLEEVNKAQALADLRAYHRYAQECAITAYRPGCAILVSSVVIAAYLGSLIAGGVVVVSLLWGHKNHHYKRIAEKTGFLGKKEKFKNALSGEECYKKMKEYSQTA